MTDKTQKLNPLIAIVLVFTAFGATQFIKARPAQALDNWDGLNKEACKVFKAALTTKNPNAAYNVVSQCISSSQMGALRLVPRGIGRTKSKIFNTMFVGIGAGGMDAFGVGIEPGTRHNTLTKI